MMRSIQGRIAMLAGACLLGTAAALVTYAVVSAGALQRYVSDHVGTLLDSKTKETLQAVASTQARRIEVELEVALDTARALAHSFAVLANSRMVPPPRSSCAATSSTPCCAMRCRTTSISSAPIRAGSPTPSTAETPSSAPARTAAPTPPGGSCPTGPAARAATSPSSRSPAMTPELAPTGVTKGGWYLEPRRTGNENVLDPMSWTVQGRRPPRLADSTDHDRRSSSGASRDRLQSRLHPAARDRGEGRPVRRQGRHRRGKPSGHRGGHNADPALVGTCSPPAKAIARNTWRRSGRARLGDAAGGNRAGDDVRTVALDRRRHPGRS